MNAVSRWLTGWHWLGRMPDAPELASLARDARMPPAVTSAFVTRYGAGLSEAETADALGISINALRIRLCRAKAYLRRWVLWQVEDAIIAERWAAIKAAKS